MTLSWIFSWTKIREPAQQTCPWLNQIALTTPSTAVSKSASSKTINGDFPPNSRDIFFPVPAVLFLNNLPTPVLPVKATFNKLIIRILINWKL